MTIEKKQCFSIEKCVPIDFQYNNSGDFDPKRTTNAQDPHPPKVDFFFSKRANNIKHYFDFCGR